MVANLPRPQALSRPDTILDRDRLQRGRVVVQGQGSPLTAQILIQAPVETVWQVITDYRNFDQFLPTVKSSRIVQRSGNRTRMEQIDQRTVMVFPIQSRVCTDNWEEAESGQIKYQLVEGDLKAMSGYWQVTTLPHQPHSATVLTHYVDADADAGLFNGAFHQILRQGVQENLRAIRSECDRRAAA